jgi:hypothetical protein
MSRAAQPDGRCMRHKTGVPQGGEPGRVEA